MAIIMAIMAFLIGACAPTCLAFGSSAISLRHFSPTAHRAGPKQRTDCVARPADEPRRLTAPSVFDAWWVPFAAAPRAFDDDSV